METTSRPVSPLRQRMIDDMRMRRLHPKTQSAYIRAVCNFTRFLGRSPDTATVEELRNYQLHLVDCGTSPMSLNAAISGLKFFFDVTLERGDSKKGVSVMLPLAESSANRSRGCLSRVPPPS